MSDQNNQGFFDGNPKMIFLFGLVTGVAISLILGGSLPTFSMNGGGSDKGTDIVVNDGSGNAVDQGAGEPAVLAAVTEDDWILGDLDKAKVVLVEYSDYECPFCERHHPTMQQIVEEYGDDVAWVYRHFPLSFHPEATPSAEAAECVGSLGGDEAFWSFTDGAFENQDALGDDLYLELALEAGVNESDFLDCYESGEFASEVTADMSSGRAAGVEGTPATFVNGQLVSGAVPYATFQDIIEQELAK